MTEPEWVDSSSPSWPDRLAHLESPPPGFWQLGTGGPVTPCVAVVGSRRATFQGVDIARSIGGELGAAGIQVVSGMALGIDAGAHTGALDAGGTTVAVLGCGIDDARSPYCIYWTSRSRTCAFMENLTLRQLSWNQC